MQRIAPISTDQPGLAEAIFNTVKQQMGSVPNIFATMAQSPSVLEGFLAFNGALGYGVLDSQTREQIALTVAGANDCDYCASAHTLLAKGAGVMESEVTLSLSGSASDAKTNAILEFTTMVVNQRGHVGNHELEALRGNGVTDAELVEILAHIGINLFTNYFNHVAQTAIDFPFVAANPSESSLNH
ncbi:MAG: carboxymuconolactone decarboxylase family protein [Pseudomonadales bacterium]